MSFCAMLLSSVIGSWLGGVRGRPTLYAAVGVRGLSYQGRAHSFSVESHRRTTNMSSSPLPPLPRAAGVWVQPAWEPRQLPVHSGEELSIANHNERTFLGGKIRGSIFPVLPPHSLHRIARLWHFLSVSSVLILKAASLPVSQHFISLGVRYISK